MKAYFLPDLRPVTWDYALSTSVLVIQFDHCSTTNIGQSQMQLPNFSPWSFGTTEQNRRRTEPLDHWRHDGLECTRLCAPASVSQFEHGF